MTFNDYNNLRAPEGPKTLAPDKPQGKDMTEYEYYKNDMGIIYNGDSLQILKQLPSEIIQTIITSPPYWGLRDYQCDGQIGLEMTIDEYISKLVSIFDEVYRILKKDGTLWLNLGDCYNNNKPGSRDSKRWPKQSSNDHMPDKRYIDPFLKKKRPLRYSLAGCLCSARCRLVFKARYNLA